MTTKDQQALVIVVDDDEAVRSSMKLLLKSVGLPAVAYSSAQEFLENHDPQQPGCVVLDVRM
ncbi:MAG TPA: response regulator, partial [Steroidobacteraceae bacterium]